MATMREAFLKTLREHETRLRAYVGALIRDVHFREDVFQDIVVALWKAWPRYDAERPFGPWARGVATRQVLKAARASRRFPCVFPPETIALIQEQFERTEETACERAAALQLCVEGLPDHARQMLVLRYTEGMACADIGDKLGQSLDSVHQTLSRLRSRLADCVRRRLNRETVLTS
jgi:RNA polymerase sigma-70 factor (ECF subfamily)